MSEENMYYDYTTPAFPEKPSFPKIDSDLENYKDVTYVCPCSSFETMDTKTSDPPEVKRKIRILSTVARTEEYLRNHHIPEFIQFLLTKLLSQTPDNPIVYLDNILDDCMLFRAGLGVAPVLYDMRHLEAVVNNFDPGKRGWLSANQVKQVFTTLGLTIDELMDSKISTEHLLNVLKQHQQVELMNMISDDDNKMSTSSSSGTTSSK